MTELLFLIAAGVLVALFLAEFHFTGRRLKATRRERSLRLTGHLIGGALGGVAVWQLVLWWIDSSG